MRHGRVQETPCYTGAMSGVALMLAACGCFAVMSALVKALGPGFPFAEAVMFRALFGLVALGAAARWRRIALRPKRYDLLVVRGLFGLTAMSCYFYALQRGLLANVVMIGRLQPVLVALLAPLLLRERAQREVVAALALGLGGVLLVVRPSYAGVDAASVAALIATLASALAHLTLRRLGATDHPWTIVLVFSAITTVGGGLLALPAMVWPTGLQWTLLAGIAACATFGQLLMTTAYRREVAPVVSAAGYSWVVYALVLGVVFWGEIPDAAALAGGAAIVVGGVVLLARRRAVAPAET